MGESFKCLSVFITVIRSVFYVHVIFLGLCSPYFLYLFLCVRAVTHRMFLFLFALLGSRESSIRGTVTAQPRRALRFRREDETSLG